jgi:hypothetical protein
MSIVKRPPKKSVDDFIKGAPDSVPSAAAPAAAVADETIKRVMLGKQAQISLAMPLYLLARIDEQAVRLSISRAAYIKQAVSRAVEGEGV